jgi:hypothetical protein
MLLVKKFRKPGSVSSQHKIHSRRKKTSTNNTHMGEMAGQSSAVTLEKPAAYSKINQSEENICSKNGSQVWSTSLILRLYCTALSATQS